MPKTRTLVGHSGCLDNVNDGTLKKTKQHHTIPGINTEGKKHKKLNKLKVRRKGRNSGCGWHSSVRTNKFFTCVCRPGYLHVGVWVSGCGYGGCVRVSAAMSAKCGRVNEIKVENRKQNTQHDRLRRIQNNQLKSHGRGMGTVGQDSRAKCNWYK